MKRVDISKASIADLLDQYVKLSIEQGVAIELCQGSTKVNRLGDLIFDISDELKRRPGDQLQVLVGLLDSQNPYVRFNSATSVIGLARVRARQVIQDIADSKIYPIAGQAGMYLSVYDGEASKLLRKP